MGREIFGEEQIVGDGWWNCELHLANINFETPVTYLNEDITWPGDMYLIPKGKVTKWRYAQRVFRITDNICSLGSGGWKGREEEGGEALVLRDIILQKRGRGGEDDTRGRKGKGREGGRSVAHRGEYFKKGDRTSCLESCREVQESKDREETTGDGKRDVIRCVAERTPCAHQVGHPTHRPSKSPLVE